MEYKNKISLFTDLEVWKKGHEVVLLIYQITKDFPKDEIFGLTSQIRRAVVSITSNIAEGFGRKSFKEKVLFYDIARSSVGEVQNQLIIARDVKYLENDNFEKIFNLTVIISKMLFALIKSSRTHFSSNS